VNRKEYLANEGYHIRDDEFDPPKEAEEV